MFYSSEFELQVRPNGRAAADEYYHEGNHWIEGREGSKYTIWFKNNSYQRVMVIVSVDGLDVCKGQPAGPDSDGYIVDAQSSIEIPGWKLDNQTAAEFYFAKIGKSYAHANGSNSNNVGVIGAMVFREKRYYPTYNINNSYSHPGIACASSVAGSSGINNMVYNGGTLTSSLRSAQWVGSSAASATVGANTVGSNSISFTEQGVGTGFGDATQFSTTIVNFERANQTVPDAIMVLYYNSAKNLQRMGIQLRTKSSKYYDTSSKNAFPGYTTGCTPPPGWTK